MLGCPVRTLQDEKEINWLIDRVKVIQPRKVIEIGSFFGGTLWTWMQICPTGSHFVSVDKLISDNNPDYAQQIQGHDVLWSQWAEQHGHTLKVFEADSTRTATAQLVKAEMPQVDFLFIDADHHYAMVKRDYELYSPLVRPGGLIAFHDIGKVSDPDGYGVHTFWSELVGEDREGFMASTDEKGIGLIKKRSI